MAWWIFQNLVVTTALAGIVVAIGRAARQGPVVTHALWLVVLIKFVTPPLLVWPWAAPDPLGIATSFTATRPAAIVAGAPDGRSAALAPIGPDATRGSAGQLRSVDPPGPGLEWAAIWPWLFGLWVVGSLCLVAIESVRFSRLARQVRSALPADPVIVRRVADLSERLGIRAIPVVAVDGIRSPAVWGVGRVKLLWPVALAADSSDACIDGLIVHELAHVKRRDHFVGWIELAAGIAWWWNPIFWLVRSKRREQSELACDAWVISALPDGRRAYAESLLMLAAFDLPRAPSVAVGVLSPSRRALERRLIMIMTTRTPLRLSLAGAVALAVVTGATLPAWATGADQLPPPVTPSVSTPAAVQSTPPLPPVAPSPVQDRVTPQVNPPARQSPPPAPPSPQSKPAAIKPRWLPTGMSPANLPADGRQLVEGFDKEREAIQTEADRQITIRREATAKALEALQEQYTKAGKLDEAIAIRDYLRNGGLDRLSIWLRRK